MDDFRSIGELVGHLVAELGDNIGSSGATLDPGKDQRAQRGFFECAEIDGAGIELAGVPDWRPKTRDGRPAPSTALTPTSGASDPATPPARRQAGEVLRGKLVVIDGRAARTASPGQPRPAARLSIAAINGVRVHQAVSGMR